MIAGQCTPRLTPIQTGTRHSTAGHTANAARGTARRTKSAITAPDSAPITRSADGAPLVMPRILRGGGYREPLEGHGEVSAVLGRSAHCRACRTFALLWPIVPFDDQLPVLRRLAVRGPEARRDRGRFGPHHQDPQYVL